jgi:CHASE3 domain sensor protein
LKKSLRLKAFSKTNYSVSSGRNLQIDQNQVSGPELKPALFIALWKTDGTMKTESLENSFRKIAGKIGQTIREEWSDLQTQWAPEKEEAALRFENLKEKYRATLQNIEQQAIEKKEEGLEKIQDLIQELRLQLALGKAETLEAFEEQKSAITHRWSVLRNHIESNPAYRHLGEELMDWRVKMDLLRIQYALGKMELSSNWKDISSKLKTEFGHLEKAAESGAGIAGEKIDQLEEEVKAGFERIFGKP